MKTLALTLACALCLALAGCGEAQNQPVNTDGALAVALKNADVPKDEAYNVKIKEDKEGGIPVYKVEFETSYGDYDFEIATADGRIVGADYEVKEEWLDRLGGKPVDMEAAKRLVQQKVEDSSADNVRIWQEADDGRMRYEGELFYNGMKYEFEIDPRTGRIFDWNADLRK